jgi:hypothetical protein
MHAVSIYTGCASLAILAGITYSQDIYFHQAGVMAFISFVIIFFFVVTDFTKPMPWFLGYLVARILWQFVGEDGNFNRDHVALLGLLNIFCFCLGTLEYGRTDLIRLAAQWMIFPYYIMTLCNHPPFYNPTINAFGFLLLTCLWWSPWLFMLSGIVCLFQAGTSPVIIWLLCGAIYIRKVPRIVIGGFTLSCLLGLAIWIGEHNIHDLIRMSDRFGFWRFILSQWPKDYWLFGAGYNQFMVIGPTLQKLLGYSIDSGYWVSLHNDWLQWLVEMGAVGLGLLAWLYGWLVFKFYNKPRELALTLAFGLFMLVYFPLRIAPFWIVLGYLWRKADSVLHEPKPNRQVGRSAKSRRDSCSGDHGHVELPTSTIEIGSTHVWPQ